MRLCKIARPVFCVAIGSMLYFLITPIDTQATTVSGNSTEIVFHDTPSGTTTVKIAVPGGEVYSVPSLAVSFEPGLPNGDYQYELIGPLSPSSQAMENLTSSADPANGRDETKKLHPIGVLETGDFRIIDGSVIDTKTMVEEN